MLYRLHINSTGLVMVHFRPFRVYNLSTVITIVGSVGREMLALKVRLPVVFIPERIQTQFDFRPH